MIAEVGWILVVVALLVIAAILLVFAAYQSSRQRVGYIPLPTRAVPAVIKALGLKASGTVCDLGCGDGRILAAALQSNPELSGVGVEYNPVVSMIAHWRLRALGSRARVVRGDLMGQDLSDARYLFTYLSDPQMALLEPKLERELPKGARLVSCDFPLPKRNPSRTIKIGETWQLGQTLYIYTF